MRKVENSPMKTIEILDVENYFVFRVKSLDDEPLYKTEITDELDQTRISPEEIEEIIENRLRNSKLDQYLPKLFKENDNNDIQTYWMSHQSKAFLIIVGARSVKFPEKKIETYLETQGFSVLNITRWSLPDNDFYPRRLRTLKGAIKRIDAFLQYEKEIVSERLLERNDLSTFAIRGDIKDLHSALDATPESRNRNFKVTPVSKKSKESSTISATTEAKPIQSSRPAFATSTVLNRTDGLAVRPMTSEKEDSDPAKFRIVFINFLQAQIEQEIANIPDDENFFTIFGEILQVLEKVKKPSPASA